MLPETNVFFYLAVNAIVILPQIDKMSVNPAINEILKFNISSACP